MRCADEGARRKTAGTHVACHRVTKAKLRAHSRTPDDHINVQRAHCAGYRALKWSQPHVRSAPPFRLDRFRETEKEVHGVKRNHRFLLLHEEQKPHSGPGPWSPESHVRRQDQHPPPGMPSMPTARTSRGRRLLLAKDR